jgi:hypothetical protein
MVAEELDPLLPAEYGDTWTIADGSWQADFRKDGADLLACYGDSGGSQGWVRISDDGFGFQVLHADWERCLGDYSGEGVDRYGVQVLRSLWNEIDGEWSCWAIQRLGWEGDPEEGTPTDADRIVRPPHVLDAVTPVQDTVPVHLLTSGQFAGKACEYSTPDNDHDIEKFVAWSEDATDLQVCTRPECIEKLCVEADKNRAANLPKADLENGPSDNDPGLEGFDGNPDAYYNLVELLAEYDKAGNHENPYTAMEERDMAAWPLVEALRTYLGVEKPEEK